MQNTPELDQLKQVTYALQPLPDIAWEEFAALWKPIQFKRKETITAAGEPEHYLYFVTKGVQRVYYLDDENREATMVFTYAPSFGGVLDALLLKTPSKYFYESLTHSEFLRADAKRLHELMNRHESIHQLVRAGLTSAFSGVLERMAELQCFTNEARFQSLMKRSPHLLNLIPHKYIANYLGMDATNFSKLVNKVRII